MRRISRSSNDDRETSFLFQLISVLLFRFNSVLCWTTARSSIVFPAFSISEFFLILVFTRVLK